MAIGQQKTGCVVVELSVQPCVKRMAGFACGREFCCYVIGIGGFLKIRQVTGRARGRESQVLSDSSVLVTLLAFHHSVRSEERKSVEVLLDRLNRYLPTQDGVALGAIGAELAAVDVCVAVRAVLTDVSKDRLEVALRAVDFFMYATKGISRGVVIEFGNGANRGPARVRVAVFAGNGKGAVRTPAGLPLGTRRKGAGKSKEHNPTADLEYSRNDCPQRL
jgi:hypothetical protein